MKRMSFLLVVVVLALSSCDFLMGLFAGDESVVGMDTLGRGYDIFDSYADRIKVKEPILDIDALEQAEMVENVVIEMSAYKSITGTDIASYSTALMQECSVSGSYGGFSGAIEQSFSEERYTSTEYSFATVNIYVHKYGLLLKDRQTVASLEPYLADTFESRLNDPEYSPQDLFSSYGTHCMTGVIVGARLDYNVSAKTSDISGSKSIGVYAEASYKNVLLEVSVSASVLSETEYAQYKTSEEKRLRAYGGASEYAVSIVTKGDYDAWLETIDGNPVFCDYYDSSLTPIWEFCEEETRRTEIEAAFALWATDREIDVASGPKTAIIGLSVAFSNMGDYRDIDGIRYYMLPQDLNEGAGGDDIFLYAAVGLDNDPDHPPITGLLVYNSEDAAVSDSAYSQVGDDLNRDAGGDYIYLYFSTDPSKGLPVRAINVYNQSDGDRAYSHGASSDQIYSDVLNTAGAKQDLNEGAGGDDIFFEYSRDYID